MIELLEAFEEVRIVSERLRLIVHVLRQLYLQLPALGASRRLLGASKQHTVCRDESRSAQVVV